MSKEFSLNFKMESSAFDEYPTDEICRILKNITNNLEVILPPEDDFYSKKIKDINGNTIGELIISR